MERLASKAVVSTTTGLWSEPDTLAQEDPPTRAESTMHTRTPREGPRAWATTVGHTTTESTMQVLQRLKDGLDEYPKEVWAWPEGKLYRKRIASLEAASVPKTNESIRQAVAEFKAESADFNSPKAEKKWGPVADWDVSEVTNMHG